MAEFGWAYVPSNIISGSGGHGTSCSGSLQWSTGGTTLSGSRNLIWDHCNSELFLTGAMFVSGTINADIINVNHHNKTITNISATGSTEFGDTTDDTHIFVGKVAIASSVSTQPTTKLDIRVADTENIKGINIDFDETGGYNALYIDSESTSHPAVYILGYRPLYCSQDITNGYAAKFTRNIAEAGAAPLTFIHDDHTSNTQPALAVRQDGTGKILDLLDGTTSVFQLFDGGNINLSGTTFVASSQKIQFGNTGEYIGGDGTDLDIVSSRKLKLDFGAGQGGDVSFSRGGTNVLVLTASIGGDAILSSSVTNKDIIFHANTSTEIARFDTSANSLLMAGTKKIEFGGSGTYIHSDGADLKHFNGADINLVSGVDILLDAGGDIILDADGADITFKDGGTQYAKFSSVSGHELTGSLYVSGSGITLTAGQDTGAVLTLVADNGEEAVDVTSFVVADGGNLTIDCGADITLDAAGDIILDADGADVLFKDGGVLIGALKNSSNALEISGSGVAAGSGDIILTSGMTADITLDAANDIILSADGGNVTMDDGTLTIFDFDVDNTRFTIHDDQDTGDKVVMTMAQHGAFSIITTDDDAAAANIQITADGTFEVDATTITLDSAGDIILDAQGNDLLFKDGGVLIGAIKNNSAALELSGSSPNSEGTRADIIITSGMAADITLDSANDIILSADGGNITMDDGTLTIFDFDVDNTTLTIHDDQDTGDKVVMTMAQHGAFTIETTDDDAAAANIQITADGTFEVDATTITLDSAGDIVLDADGADILFKDGGVLIGAFKNNSSALEISGSGVAAGSGDIILTSGMTADITLDAANDIILDADGADIIFKDGGTAIATFTNSSSDFLIKQNVNAKDIIFQQDDGTETLRLTNAGSAKFVASVSMKEQSAAVSDTAAYGQLWVRDAAPNQLYFTTDAGDDIQLTSGTVLSVTASVALDDLSDASFSSGDLTITALDKLTTSAAAHDTAGTAVVIQAGTTTAGTTNNIAGGSLTLAGGQGKGSGAGGDIVFQTANEGGSGSSLNALATALTISDDLSSTFVGVVDITNTTDASDNSGDTGALRVEGGVSIAKKLYVGTACDIAGTLTVAQYVGHTGDANTRLNFTPDALYIEAGGLEMMHFVEAAQDAVTINDGGGDVDFRVETSGESHMLFVEGSSNRISIGDSTDAVAATLEVTNANDGGVPLLQLNSNDTDQIAVDINAANIDANVLDITAAAVTTGYIVNITSSALTTGQMLRLESTSPSTDNRALAVIVNENAEATGCISLAVRNDAAMASGRPTVLFQDTAANTEAILELRNSNVATDKPAILKFNRSDATAEADDMSLGQIDFYGVDAGDNSTQYAKILARASDVTANDEAGELKFYVMCHTGSTVGDHNTTLTEALHIGGNDAAAGTSTTVQVNQSNADIDFMVRGTNINGLLRTDAANDRVGVGTSSPGALLEIEQGSAGGDTAFLIDNDDTDQIAMSIEAANIDADVIDIVADAVTTARAIDIQCDGLTTGNMIGLDSNSAEADTRNLMFIVNNHASATGATNLYMRNDAGVGIMTAEGKSGAAMTLTIKEVAITISTSGTTTTSSNFFPALAMPLALSIRVTTAISAGHHITKIGTDTIDDLFAGGDASGGALNNGVLDELNDLLSMAITSAGPYSAAGGATAGINAAQDLVIETAGTATQGVVRAVLYYWDITPPTS